MNANVAGADAIVGEYLIYRGFTQSFQCLEAEKNKDRLKKFEVSKIVETIFQNLTTFDFENFILLWDFLSKRFFFHLDAEHVQLCAILKSDLLKFYLINAIKTRNRDKVVEFFSHYSHEILAESGTFISGNVRNWFVLPYMDEPEKDQEFAVYFSARWSELLRITLHNFLSVVLSSAPPPKLLLLEKWFRSEAQQEMRSQLRLSSRKIDCLIERIDKYEDRLQNLREVLRGALSQLHKATVSAGQAKSAVANGSLFEMDEELEEKREKIKELGQSAVKLSADCKSKAQLAAAMSPDERQREKLGEQYFLLALGQKQISSNQLMARPQVELEELEAELIEKCQEWLSLLAAK